MNLICSLFGHKPLILKVTGPALFSVQDELGIVYDVHPCERCHVLYWTGDIIRNTKDE